MRRLAVVLMALVLAGCMSERERAEAIQTQRAIVNLSRLRIQQAEDRLAATKGAQAGLLLSDSITEWRTRLVMDERKLAKLMK